MRSFRVLGPVEVRVAERPVPLGGALQRKLLAFLLIHANRAVSSDALIDALWGAERGGALKRLQMAVARLRKALEPLETDHGSLLRTVSSGYVLTVADGELDADVFADLVRDGRRALKDGNPTRASELLEEALGLWRGTPMAEVAFEDFAQSEIRRLEGLHLVAIETRIDADLQLGRHVELIAELESLHAEQPAREGIAGQLMTALYRCGRQADALEVYRHTRARLIEDLGLEPGPALRAIEMQILSQDAAVAQAEIQPRPRSRTNLPTPVEPLIGRREEMSKGLEQLASEDTRLLTLWGPGGSGKTRLALELGTAALDRYRDGVWIAALAPIRDPSLVVPEVAQVLEIDASPGEPIEQALLRAVSDRQLLLILDNFEHVLQAAPAVAELLAAAPGVTVLATSREPLRIRGEHLAEVAPLPPDDAAELFLARARAVRPDLAIDKRDQEAIDGICARLDCLPLALELAAARAAVFSPRMLEQRLGERLTLPEGARDLPARQRTLSATIDWSYQLLDPAEQALLGWLSPFVGGVGIESAELLWGRDATELLISLAEKSVLRRRDDPDGAPRFWLLETVREFVLERAVAGGVASSAATRHAEHYCGLTDLAAPELRGREQRRWVSRLEQEHSNLRAALDHLTEHDPSTGIRMAANLKWFWLLRGYASEGYRRLVEVLASAPADAPDRGAALAAAGQMSLDLGEAAQAEPPLLEALALARRDGDAWLTAHALSHLGCAAEALGDLGNSEAHHLQAIATAREAAGSSALETALNNYGLLSARRGDLAAARPLFEEALLLARRRGEPRVISLVAGNLAVIALDAGELETADALIDESLVHARDADYRAMVASSLAAQTMIALERGDLDHASARLSEAIDASRSIRHIETAASSLSLAGTVAAMRHQPALAATLWAAADRNRDRIHLAEDPNVERFRAKWQPDAWVEGQGAATWDAAWTAGDAMSLDEALDLAAMSTTIVDGDRAVTRTTAS